MWLNYGFFMSDNPAETYCLKFALNTDDLDYDAKLYLLEGFDDDDEKAESLFNFYILKNTIINFLSLWIIFETYFSCKILVFDILR